MRASTAELHQSEERLKEYQRQQERLKAMTANSDKVKSMSADVMIENLLKQNFVKPNSTTVENKINSGSGLPNWLECESPEVPGLYKNLWTFVKTPTNFADTQKVSQLLLTSGLHVEVLGYIWNLSNKAVPGQLNKQEFYIVLALVALAQSGYSFNNLSILNLVPTAPIPALQIPKVLEKFAKSPTVSNNYVSQISPVIPLDGETFSLSQLPHCKVSEHSSFSAAAVAAISAVTVDESPKDLGELKLLKKPQKNNLRETMDNGNRDFPKTSCFPYIGSSPTAELEEEDDFSEFQSASISEPPFDNSKKKEDSTCSSQSDEFTDFQCADIISDPLETVVISQKKEIPKISLPRNLGGKLSNLRTNILKISPESEKKLKGLTQSETLSTLPESKISTNNKVSTVTSISVLAGSRDIGMRLANHSSGPKPDKSKHHRHKHKQPANVDEIVFSSKFGTMNELFPKCFQRSSGGTKTYVLKETKIGSTDSQESESSSRSDADVVTDIFSSGKNTRKIEIPMLGTFNETTLPTQVENVYTQPTVELFSVEEDKYSALREVELEMKMKNNEAKKPGDNESIHPSDGIDDFGEFFSAEIPVVLVEETDLWGEWNNPDPVLQTKCLIIDKPLECLNDTEIEDEIKTIDNHEKIVEDTINTLNFDLLNLTEEGDSKNISTIPELGLEVLNDVSNKNVMEDPFTSMTELGKEQLSNADKIIQCFDDLLLDSSKIDEAGQCPNAFTLPSNNLDEEFGMFFTSEYTPPPREVNRDEYMPSLNLKMLPSEANEQEAIRKKCLVVCLNIMQQGLDILNGVSSAAVLREVLSTEEAVNYLNNLNIIYQISKRIGANSCELLFNQEDIERVWQKLVRYCCDYRIPLREDLDSSASMGTQCHVCLGFIGNDIIDRGLSSYHPSCANFWLNCVESELPCST